MPISPKGQALIERIKQELDEIEREVTEGLALLGPIMLQFPNNDSLIQFFAYFQTTLFFVNYSRIRIQSTTEQLSVEGVSEQTIQEAGEDLAILLGEIIENKIRSQNFLRRLRNLP